MANSNSAERSNWCVRSNANAGGRLDWISVVGLVWLYYCKMSALLC